MCRDEVVSIFTNILHIFFLVQKQEIAEDSEEMMDTSVKQTEGGESQTSVEDQSASSSQEVKKSVKQTEGDEIQTSVGDQSASNSQEVKKSESKTEIVNQNKTTKVHLRAQVKVGACICFKY